MSLSQKNLDPELVIKVLEEARALLISGDEIYSCDAIVAGVLIHYDIKGAKSGLINWWRHRNKHELWWSYGVLAEEDPQDYIDDRIKAIEESIIFWKIQSISRGK